MNLSEEEKHFTLVDIGCGYGDYIKNIYHHFGR